MKGYTVYEHVFPNGKKYIGITSTEPQNRWMKDGSGYKNQGKIWNAIQHYGWNNVEHNVIVDGLTEEQATELEKYLIAELDTIDNGYNTSIGGENINTTYLNPHVLMMIRKSKEYDEKYAHTQKDDDIVSICEGAKYIKASADIVNAVDMLIDEKYPEYKKYSGKSLAHDFGGARVDCYWWYVAKILNGEAEEVDELISKNHSPYWECWAKTELGLEY